jgi:hypothetical protein
MINDSDQEIQLPINYNHFFKSQLNNKILIFIYQITCKDPFIKDHYIGQTESFEQRKYSHSKDSEISELKIYKIMRKYGGWENWNMKIINHYYCKNDSEARQIEQKYIDIFKPTMNSMRACSKSFIDQELDRQLEFEIKDFSDKILGCYVYDYIDLDLEEQLECEFCKKILSTIYSLKSHQKTVKSCLKIQGKLTEISYFNCEYCDKKFTIKSNLSAHDKICKKRLKAKRDIEIRKKELDIKNAEILQQLIEENNNLKDEKNKIKNENEKILKNMEIENKKDKSKIKRYKKEIDKLKEELYFVKGQLKILTKQNDVFLYNAK